MQWSEDRTPEYSGSSCIPNLLSSRVRNQKGGDGESGKIELGVFLFFSFLFPFLLNRRTWSQHNRSMGCESRMDKCAVNLLNARALRDHGVLDNFI